MQGKIWIQVNDPETGVGVVNHDRILGTAYDKKEYKKKTKGKVLHAQYQDVSGLQY
jgi:hypothetical protein